ncbi:hypothetical protein M9Y10_029604 [Tritrichomonas musculus]|uniref:Uncharacterized protein n=1 Tax=Tritrichomonas musculus TaxID=1915356 RepID=A0ABR2KN08_9EUKA
MEASKFDLPSHLAKAKEIAIDGLDRSSVFDCLEMKISEATKLKEENLYLNTQIKILTESMKLQEAEYAFQRNEYEQEIQMHKTNEENLKQSLLKFETQAPIDIEIYQKYQDLQENYDNALKRIKELEEGPQKYQNKYNKIRTAYQELQASIPKFQKKIDRRNKAIEDLTQQIQKKDEEMNNLLKNSGMNSSSSQISIQKMNQKFQRQTAKLQQLEARNAEVEKQLSHCESEFEVLNDILDIKSPIQDEWVEVRNKIKSLIENVSNNKNDENAVKSNDNSEITITNTIANNSNTAAELKIKSDQKNEQNENIRELEMKLLDVNDAYKRATRFASQQKIRSIFARTIAKNHSFLINKISELHDVMFESEPQTFRPFVLMAVFLIRWFKIKQHTISSDFDEVSLLSFSASPKLSFSQKIDKLQSKYVELTTDLINSKKSLIEFQQKVDSLQATIDQNEANTEGQRNELAAAKDTIESLKEYSNSIQEELALAIPPEKFEETLTKVTYLELEIDSLSLKVKKLNEEMEDKDILIQDLSREIKANDFIKESKEEEIKDIRKISEDRCHEIEVLRAKLKDKTKELLALERLIHQTNPLLLNSVTLKDENQEQNNINPAFLRSPTK